MKRPVAARAIWEVRAGILPQQPLPELTKRWFYTSEMRAEDEAKSADLSYHSHYAKLRAEAIDYYVQLSMPHLNNWAELTFLWL